MRRWVLAHQLALGIAFDVWMFVVAALLSIVFVLTGDQSMQLIMVGVCAAVLLDLTMIIKTGKVLWYR